MLVITVFLASGNSTTGKTLKGYETLYEHNKGGTNKPQAIEV